MSEQQATPLTPTDSVSNAGGRKKARPGKAQRAAARGGYTPQASATTGSSSVTGASSFSARASFAPVPQPGKYPVVFPSGAGEATKDVEFALNGDSISSALAGLADDFINSARYAEFSANASYGDDSFRKDVARFSLLAIAQQIVHAHSNMQLSIGDMSAISATDHYMMRSIRSIVEQFGEFSVDQIGSRYVLADYESTVKSLIIAAAKISGPQVVVANIPFFIRTMWLPSRANDPKTTFVVAEALSRYTASLGVKIPVEELRSKLFSQPSDAFIAAKARIDPAERNHFDVLFNGYTTQQEFTSKFSGAVGDSILNRLGLFWGTQNGRAANHMDWDLVPKIKFPELVDYWAKRRATITKFFSCGSGLAEKSNATGSAAQLSRVEHVAGVTVVRSRLALSAPEFSLLACFPPCAIVADDTPMNVVLSTSIPVKIRATEFTQLDWIG